MRTLVIWTQYRALRDEEADGIEMEKGRVQEVLKVSKRKIRVCFGWAYGCKLAVCIIVGTLHDSRDMTSTLPEKGQQELGGARKLQSEKQRSKIRVEAIGLTWAFKCKLP